MDNHQSRFGQSKARAGLLPKSKSEMLMANQALKLSIKLVGTCLLSSRWILINCQAERRHPVENLCLVCAPWYGREQSARM